MLGSKGRQAETNVWISQRIYSQLCNSAGADSLDALIGERALLTWEAWYTDHKVSDRGGVCNEVGRCTKAVSGAVGRF